jgi:hypothetical protein
MSDDLLQRVAPLDPVEEQEMFRVAREMKAEVDSRVAAVGVPPPTIRWFASRRVQAVLAACLAAALVGVMLTSILRDGTAPGSRIEDGWLVVGSLEDLRGAQITYVLAAHAFVVAPASQAPYALSAVSPHSGYGYEELLLYCRPSEIFVELQHGGSFDIEGHYRVGPSPSGMFGVPLRIVDGRVEIDPTTLLPAPPRDSNGASDGRSACPFDRAGWSEPGFVELGGPGNALQEMTFWHGPGDAIGASTPVSTVAGTNCGFPVPTWLQLTDPLGSQPAPDDSNWRYYAADPDGAWADRESTTFSRTDPLPDTAGFTGYRSMLYELWVDPATVGREVWVVRVDPNGGRTVERWPRVDIPQCEPPSGPG